MFLFCIYKNIYVFVVCVYRDPVEVWDDVRSDLVTNNCATNDCFNKRGDASGGTCREPQNHPFMSGSILPWCQDQPCGVQTNWKPPLVTVEPSWIQGERIWAYQYTMQVVVGAWRHVQAWYHAGWWGLGDLCQQNHVRPVWVSELFASARF